MKLRMKISAVLLLALLVFSLSQAIGMKTASADEYGNAVFCPNNYVDGLDTQNELYVTSTICQYISWYMRWYYAQYFGSYYYYFLDGSQQNPIRPSDYSSVLDDLQGNCEKVTVFTKGHCTPWGYNWNHRQLLCTLSSWDPPNDEQAKDSIHIWPYTGNFKNRFSFIWHCGTAEMYPLSPPYQDINGSIGMPFCFTHNVNMDYYGSNGNYVYLGWIWASPQFNCPIPDQYWPDYFWWFHFAYYFFEQISYGYPVMQTLQNLSWAIYNQDFFESPLNGWLVVWGNGNMNLGY